MFPYQSKNGRYKYTFHEAKEVCAQQDGTLASYSQLFRGTACLKSHQQYVVCSCFSSLKSACVLLQRGRRVWTGVTPAGSTTGPFITPSFTLDRPVEERCSPASAVTDQKTRITIGLTLSASPPRRQVSFEGLGSDQHFVWFPDRKLEVNWSFSKAE